MLGGSHTQGRGEAGMKVMFGGGVFRYAFGYVRYSLEGVGSEKAMSHIFRELSVNIFDISKAGEQGFCFSCANPSSKRVAKIASTHTGVSLAVIKREGLCEFAKAHADRCGIVIGLLLCLVLSFFSERLIWQIEIEGNTSIPDEEIAQELLSLGFGEGSYYPAIDLERLYRDMLLLDKRLAWMSINIKGTVAMVNVREVIGIQGERREDVPVNIVASRNGEIVRIDVLRGGKEVENGEYVTKGQLLISPFFKTRVSGSMFQIAKGHVYAKTSRRFEVSLPFVAYEKRYTGEEKSETRVILLGRNVFIGKSFGLPYERYDISHEERYVTLFDSVKLPIKLKKRVYREYALERVTFLEQELESRAYDEMYTLIGKELDGADILEISFESAVRDGLFTLVCNVDCIEDIALEEEVATTT